MCVFLLASRAMAAMGGVCALLLLLALCGPAQPQAGPLTAGLDLLADGEASGTQDGLSALHREYDKVTVRQFRE